jgi:phospholipid/cholesterol/gamma-HCH transport system permease protein
MALLDDRPKTPNRVLTAVDRRFTFLDVLGDQIFFFLKAIAWIPRAVRRYGREITRLMAEVSFGSGALAVIGGTIGVMVGMTAFTGVVVGLQGYSALNQVGTPALAGFISAYFNTRVMGVPSIPYLVTTRIIAGFLAIIPLYAIGLLTSYIASRQVTIWFFGQSAGTYDHYFHLFLPPIDVLYSFGKVLVFSVVVVLAHCYYGFRATGGPAGVGVAVGRSVRTSLVAVNVIDLFLSLALWGATTTVQVAG